MLPAVVRCSEIFQHIENNQFFVIHSARQSGKTTVLQHAVNQINNEGNYYALYCSLESVQHFTEPEQGMPAIIKNIKLSVELNPNFSHLLFPENFDWTDYSNMIQKYLTYVAKNLDKPLVILFDEADCLSDGTLITFLRQLRGGYINRGIAKFVHSLALVGMRNIRDYKSKIRTQAESSGSASPFNIISKSLTLKNFTKDEISTLYNQHTQATGQIFLQEAVDKVHDYTAGQPWLVNAIANECVEEILNKDYSQPITAQLIERAKENIIQRRDTHIDSLLERLKEERVRIVIEPIILGGDIEFEITSDNTAYCLDLGLIVHENGKLFPSNRIYKEIILRALTADSQFILQQKIENIWLKNNKIDMTGMLKAFQQFWRENSEIWIEKHLYKEAAPHLILQAFLQRVVNGGGQILREYASGRGRMDLCVIYANEKYPIELKLYYDTKTRPKGLEQISQYMDTVGSDEGWLIIFDRKTKKPWKQKITWKTEKLEDKIIHVVGC